MTQHKQYNMYIIINASIYLTYVAQCCLIILMMKKMDNKLKQNYLHFISGQHLELSVYFIYMSELSTSLHVPALMCTSEEKHLTPCYTRLHREAFHVDE